MSYSLRSLWKSASESPVQWSHNVTTFMREPTTCAWIRASYHRCARILRLPVSVLDCGSWLLLIALVQFVFLQIFFKNPRTMITTNIQVVFELSWIGPELRTKKTEDVRNHNQNQQENLGVTYQNKNLYLEIVSYNREQSNFLGSFSM